MKFMPAHIFAILLSLGSSTFAEISVEILTVGFTGEAGHLYRGGSYAPLGVRLTLANEKERQVNLRVEQNDLDGDIVIDELAIALTPDRKGTRLRWLYFVPNPDTSLGAEGLSLQVVDENGTALEVVHQGERTRRISLPNSPEIIYEKSFLILSIGEQTKGKIGTISDYQADEDSPFAKPIRVAHISPDLVPDHWIGLEMVDAIVWEGANPTQSTMTLNQQHAILDWVRHGGRLLIAAGNTSDALKSSEFREHLPMRITGVKAERVLPGELPNGNWNQQSSEEDAEYPEPIQVAQCELNQGAEVLVQSLAGTQTYFARKPLGRGSIAYLSLTLRDLFHVGGDAKKFFRRSLLLRRKSAIDAPQQGMWGLSGEPIDLFSRMTRFIGFEAKTTIYMLVAIIFVVAYGLLATWGAWFVLQRRNMLQYSWTAFLAIAGGASLISVVAVRAKQGLGRELHQLSIVDTTVNTYAAVAHCFFGMKTSSYVQDVDFLLPQGPPDQTDALRSPHYLRPLSPRISIMGTENRFADTKRYESQPTRAQLNNVPIRATLKQLEGYWRGSTNGQVSANIRFLPQLDGERQPFTSDSTITNNLGHDLVNCYLIEATLDPDDPRVRGGRSETIYVHPIGTIRDSEEVHIVPRLGGLNVAGKKYPEDYTLRNFQKAWAGDLSGLGSSLVLGSFAGDPFRKITREQRAIMLLSTFLENEPEIDASAGSFSFRGRPELLQTNSRWLDRSGDLTPRSLLLIGFAMDEAGPAVLYMRSGNRKWGFLLPSEAMTVYRVTIPVEREP